MKVKWDRFVGAAGVVCGLLMGSGACGAQEASGSLPVFPESHLVRKIGLGTLDGLVVSPDGSLMGTVGGGGVHLWDAASGKRVQELYLPRYGATCGAISPDGVWFAAGSSEGFVAVWRIDSAELIRLEKRHSNSIRSIHFLNDGRELVTASWDRRWQRWEWDSGRLLSSGSHSSNGIRALLPLPDSGRLLTVDDRGSFVRCWDLETGTMLTEVGEGSERVGSVAVSPDGRRVITGESRFPGMIRVWDLESATLTLKWQADREGVRSLAVLEDGDILSGSRGAVFRWDSGDGGLKDTIDLSLEADARLDGDFLIEDLVVASDQTGFLASLEHLGVVRGSLDGGAPELLFSGHSGWINDLEWALGGSLLTAGTSVGGVLDIAAGSSVPVRRLSRLDGPVSDVSVIGETDRVAVGVRRRGLSGVWNTATDDQLVVFGDEELLARGDQVGALSLTPDGTRALCAHSDNLLRLWDTESGELIHTFTGHSGFFNSISEVAVSPLGNQALSVSLGDKTVRLWDLEAGASLLAWDELQSPKSAAFSSDGFRIYILETFKLSIWDANDGSSIRSIRHGGLLNSATRFSVSPDARFLVTGGGVESEDVVLWDLAAGKPIHVFIGHSAAIGALVFSENGESFFTGGLDGMVYEWDLGWVDETTAVPITQPRITEAHLDRVVVGNVQPGTYVGLLRYHLDTGLPDRGRFGIIGEWVGGSAIYDLGVAIRSPGTFEGFYRAFGARFSVSQPSDLGIQQVSLFESQSEAD